MYDVNLSADNGALLLADHDAAAFVGISRTTFWRRVKDGTFPQPVRIGRATRWRRDELVAAVERATAERDGVAA
jgi:Predicted transcriptional regulator